MFKQQEERERERERSLCNCSDNIAYIDYKKGNKGAKIVAQDARIKAFNELYIKLGMKDGYIIASLKFIWIVPSV